MRRRKRRTTSTLRANMEVGWLLLEGKQLTQVQAQVDGKRIRSRFLADPQGPVFTAIAVTTAPRER